MSKIKQLNLLKEIKKRHSNGVIEGRKSSIITLIELGSKDFRSPQMQDLFVQYWQPNKKDTLYIVNFEGIDVLTPSAANILIESAPEIASQYKIPILFINVKEYVLESLESEASRCDPPRIIWVIDGQQNAKLVGKVPNKLKELLELLETKGSGDARSLAELTEKEVSKKTIGNLSVYLQKLFASGLLGREKVTAIDRDEAKRGWTYNYFTAPTIKRNSDSNSILIYP